MDGIRGGAKDGGRERERGGKERKREGERQRCTQARIEREK